MAILCLVIILDKGCIHGEFVKYSDQVSSIPEINFFYVDCIRFGETTNEIYNNFRHTIKKTIVRSDVNPGKIGMEHYSSHDKPCFPSSSDRYSLKY